MKWLVASILTVLFLAGCSDKMNSVNVGSTLPPSGQFYTCLGTDGPWISVFNASSFPDAREVVNVAARLNTAFYPKHGCAQSEVPIGFTVGYRGMFVTGDSAYGEITDVNGLPSGVTITGNFEAKWTGSIWQVWCFATAYDGCRYAEPASLYFETCP